MRPRKTLPSLANEGSLFHELNELLAIGAVREYDNDYQLNIPDDIIAITFIFYRTKYKIYGIGEDENHEFGATQVSKNKFLYLSEASKLCQDPNLIFPHFYYALICGNNNEVYGSGCNYTGRLGFSEGDYIETFTKLNFEDIDNNYIVDVMNKGLCSSHNIIIFKHLITGEQLFYAFGSNRNNQTGMNWVSSIATKS